MLRILVAAAAAAAPPALQTAQPSGKWVVDFADNQCLASRAYLISGKEFAVALRPKPASVDASLWLRTERRDLRGAKVMVGGVPVKSAGMTVRNVDPSGRRMYSIALKAEERERLIASGQLRVSKGSWVADFVVPSAGPLFKTLDACTADLLQRWGLSRAAQQAIATYPEPEKPESAYVGGADYPTSALQKGVNGEAEVRVTVGTDGRARDCVVLHSSGNASLDSATCTVYQKRARYKPARTRTGAAVESPYVGNLVWLVML